jgi:glycosyltransferase involved in cell wall biosynthesis
MINVLAIVCMRNEALHAARCIGDCIRSGLDVWVIDNESSDGTREIAERFKGQGVIGISSLAWTGAFSLSDQLRAKGEIIERSAHDWIVHADADEWLASPVERQTLREGIAAADADGFNCINFNELVFVPPRGYNFCQPDYASRMDMYYFFQPHYPRLNRAWKKADLLDNSHFGGHVLAGDVRRFPTDFILRHYIALSELHAHSKYIGRVFSPEDLSKRWHGNRLAIIPESLRVRPHPGLKKLAHPLSNDFDLSTPMTKHYWEWREDRDVRSWPDNSLKGVEIPVHGEFTIRGHFLGVPRSC